MAGDVLMFSTRMPPRVAGTVLCSISLYVDRRVVMNQVKYGIDATLNTSELCLVIA